MMGHFVILEVLMIALLVIGPHTTIGQTVKAFYKNDLVDVQATCTDFSFGSASWCLSAGGVWTKFSASNPCSNVLYLAECKPVAACSSSPCSNGGTCVNAEVGYQCTCPTGYTGTNCQKSCPSGYTHNAGYCYRVIQGITSEVSARQQCRADGADLTSIETVTENNFIGGLIKRVGCTAWIGLEKIGASTYQWMATSKTPAYLNWHSGEPNNPGANDPLGNCVMMYYSDYTWNDGGCDSTYATCCVCKALLL